LFSRRSYKTQQSGRNVPLVAIVSGDADGLLVEAQNDSFQHSAIRGLEADAVALGVTGHQAGTSGLGDKFDGPAKAHFKITC